ncbi:substrate-binding domain-containing protein [Carboxylicivirga sp. N1Y90]|uniref:substrate-binding domain-containing protein n=1 Tax=Carboxylicivirga fragile TaxID=3417571 RepID=UPI003D3553C9|nr:substrate-binding domain-containing protein [Marinilabiliaceae bacterium N1Y90]
MSRKLTFFKERAEQLGSTVYVDDGNDNEALQYEKALEMFDKNIDVLVLIAINTNTAAAIVREAQSRNIPVIAYNRLLST